MVYQRPQEVKIISRATRRKNAALAPTTMEETIGIDFADRIGPEAVQPSMNACKDSGKASAISEGSR